MGREYQPRVAKTVDFMEILTQKKHFTRRIAQLYYGIDDRKHAEKVLSCANEVCINKDNNFTNTWFCDDKFCPVCQWNKTRYIYAQLHDVVKVMKDEYKFIFVTLTVRNVKADQLKAKSIEMNRAFSRYFTKGSKYGSIFKGCFRTMEITYNADRKDFHPHIHAIVAVDKDYFTSDKYVSQSELLESWRKSMKDDKIVGVSMESIGFGSSKPLEGVVAEVAKYPFKDVDLYKIPFDEALEVFSALVDTFNNRPVYRFMGVMRTIAKQCEDQREANFDFIQLGQRDIFYRYEFQSLGFMSAYRFSGLNLCELKQTVNPFTETVSKVPSWVPVKEPYNIEGSSIIRPNCNDFYFDEQEFLKKTTKKEGKK